MVKKSAKRLATNQRKQWQSLLQNNAAATAVGNNKLTRISIDTNVWYSAILYGGLPEQAVNIGLSQCQLITSSYMVNELRMKLKLDALAPYKWLNLLEKQLKRICLMVDVEIVAPIVRDPKDDPILATAILGQCTYLVTGDDDLLVLGSVKGVKIITVNTFLNIVQYDSDRNRT